MTLLKITPAVLVPWIVYHLVVFGYGEAAAPAALLDRQLFSISFLNGGVWTVRIGDTITFLTVLCGFVELLKASVLARTQVWDHALSAVFFIGAMIEFLSFGFAQTSEFFFILVALFCDLVVGFAVGMRVSRREVAVGAFGAG